MMKLAVKIAFACLALLYCGSLSAQEESLSWAEKMFEKRTHDFGVVARGAEVRYRFKLTNLYKETIHISDVRTTCGCTAAKPTKRTLRSREEAYIEATMDTQRFSHRKDSNLIVTFDAPTYAEVHIPVTVYIRTDVVLSPGAANFGAVDRGKETVRKISVAYAGRDDWAIRDVRATNKNLAVKVVQTNRGEGRVNYDLLVSLKSSAPVGSLRDQIILVTNDKNSPHVPVLVQARVEGDVTITPSPISLGTLSPGQKKTVNIVVRGKKPFAIEEIDCASPVKTFKVRLSKKIRPVHVLPITITAPQQPGKYNEVFSVRIAGRPEPVTFKAFGRILSTTATTK